MQTKLVAVNLYQISINNIESRMGSTLVYSNRTSNDPSFSIIRAAIGCRIRIANYRLTGIGVD